MDLSLISSIFALNLTILFSIVGIVKVGVHIHKCDGQSVPYADFDGESTPASMKKFNVRFPKMLLVFLSVAGLGMSLALLLIDTVRPRSELLVNWLTTATWVRTMIEYTYYRIW